MSRKDSSETIMAQAMERAKARRQAELEAKPGYTQRKNMSQLERDIEAIDYMARDMKRLAEQQGKDISWDEARRGMEQIANRADRDRK